MLGTNVKLKEDTLTTLTQDVALGKLLQEF